MLEKYISQFTDLEKVWYSRTPIDNDLTAGIITWLDSENDENLLEITADINLKYFVRSYRAAFEKIINSKINMEKFDEDLENINKANQKKGNALIRE